MQLKKSFFPIRLLLFVLWALSLVNCQQSHSPAVKNAFGNQANASRLATEESGNGELNRHPLKMHYSKHARCRMSCRHIDEQEIQSILETGTINYKKSELGGEECRKKYAVEGISKDQQRLRVIFAPCGNEMTVVTCIDLGVEWECHCN